MNHANSDNDESTPNTGPISDFEFGIGLTFGEAKSRSAYGDSQRQSVFKSKPKFQNPKSRPRRRHLDRSMIAMLIHEHWPWSRWAGTVSDFVLRAIKGSRSPAHGCPLQRRGGDRTNATI